MLSEITFGSVALSSSYKLNGYFLAIKMYNRALLDEEIVANRNAGIEIGLE